jgi:Tfp pilus assembly protein PilO
MAANDWSERTRMIVTAAVVLVVNVGLGAGLYYIYGEWQKLDIKHKQKLAEKKTLDDFVKQGDGKRLELKQLQDRFKVQESKLPDSDQVANLNVEIAAIAQAAKTKNSSFQYKGVGGGDAGAQYVRETWGTRWEGDFMGFCKLMNDIEERFPRFIAFENLSITPKNSGVVTTGTSHDIAVDLVTYRYVKLPGQ